MDTCRRPKGPKDDEAPPGPRRERGETASGRRNIPVNAVLKVFSLESRWNLSRFHRCRESRDNFRHDTTARHFLAPRRTFTPRVHGPRVSPHRRVSFEQAQRCFARPPSRYAAPDPAITFVRFGSSDAFLRTISTGFFFTVGPCPTQRVRYHPRTREHRRVLRAVQHIFDSHRRRRPRPATRSDDLNKIAEYSPISADLKLTPSLPSLHPPPIARARREPLFCVRRGDPGHSRRCSGRLRQRRRQHRYRRRRSQADWLSHGSHRGSLGRWC